MGCETVKWDAIINLMTFLGVIWMKESRNFIKLKIRISLEARLKFESSMWSKKGKFVANSLSDPRQSHLCMLMEALNVEKRWALIEETPESNLHASEPNSPLQKPLHFTIFLLQINHRTNIHKIIKILLCLVNLLYSYLFN